MKYQQMKVMEEKRRKRWFGRVKEGIAVFPARLQPHQSLSANYINKDTILQYNIIGNQVLFLIQYNIFILLLNIH